MKNIRTALLPTVCALVLITAAPVLAADQSAAPPAPAATPAPEAAKPAPPSATPTAPAVAPAATATPATVPPAGHAVIVGYVDMAKIGGESKPGKAAMQQMKDKTEKIRAQITGREKKLEKLKEEIRAQLPSLSPKEREAKARGFQKKIEEYQKFVQNAEKEMRAKDRELTAAILKSVEKIVEAYGKANGLAVVLPKQELLYLGDGVELKDITDAVLKKLNETAPAK